MNTSKITPSDETLKMVDWAVRISIPIMFSVFGYASLGFMDHEKRITVIESNRYTHREAEADREKLDLKLDEIKDLVASLNRDLIRNDTGAFVTNLAKQVEALSAEVREINKNLRISK